jgi:hypothetical protein
MRTPQWGMMNGVVSYLQDSLRGDEDLRRALGLGGTGHLVVETVYPARVFDSARNGLAFYLTDFPVAGVFQIEEESAIVDQTAGMKLTFGVQYALKGQPGDGRTMGGGTGWPSFVKMGYILEMVWWKVRDYFQNPAGLLSTYRIEYMCMDSVKFLPPLESENGTGPSIYAFEAQGEMAYPLAPWTEIGPAVEFVAHDGTITETNDDRGDYVTEATELSRPWKEES